MKIVRKIVFVLVVAAIIIGTITYFLLYNKRTSISHKKPDISVKITTLKKRTLPLTVFAYGQTISPVSVTLNTQTSGVIAAINFKPGQKVEKGELLFSLKTSDNSKLVKKLEAQAEISKEEYLRAKQLVRKIGYASMSKVELLEKKLNYQQDLSLYQQALTENQITAPVNGIISESNLAPGDVVSANQMLATIVPHGLLQIRYQLPSQYSIQVKVGQTLTFTPSNTKSTYHAIVSYVAPEISGDSGGLTLRADISNATNLLPNIFGSLQQVIQKNFQSIAIPQNLVESDSQGFYVYLYSAGKVKKQYFTPGNVNKDGYILVQSGLKVGNSLIMTNPNLLHEGQVVKLAG